MGAGEPMPLLRVSTMRAGDTAVIRLDGELDCATSAQLDAALADVIDQGHPPARVLVDAEQLSFADVSGLAPLIRARHRLPVDASLQLRNARRQVARVVRLLGLAEAFGLDL
jgi:anti-anti-sigma factor